MVNSSSFENSNSSLPRGILMNFDILYYKSTESDGQIKRRGLIFGICNIKSLDTFFHELFIKELKMK